MRPSGRTRTQLTELTERVRLTLRLASDSAVAGRGDDDAMLAKKSEGRGWRVGRERE